jgi:peptide deformylase
VSSAHDDVRPAPVRPDIVQIGRPVLRARAQEVPPEHLGSPALLALVERMITAMRTAPGVGLAAPQLGEPWRVIVLEDRPELMATASPGELTERERAPFDVRVIVNPVLRLLGEARVTFPEGCLSVSGFVALVPRALEVEVTGTDAHGVPQRWQVRGWPARILQHEVDHIDGVLYVDRMWPRTLATGDAGRLLYAGRTRAELEALAAAAPGT